METLKEQAKHNQALPICNQKFSVIIVAGGTGSRFLSDLPKQFSPLHGKPIWRWSVDYFLSFPHNQMKQLCLVIHPKYRDEFEKNLPNDARISLVEGGSTRFHSVQNALNYINNNVTAIDSIAPITLIHDAARPYMVNEAISHALSHIARHDNIKACTLAYPITQTLCRADTNLIAHDVIDRSNLWAIQTPQIFDHKILCQSIDKMKDVVSPPPTDETQAVNAAGYDVQFILSSPNNIKITLPDDLTLMEKIMTNSPKNLLPPTPDIRTGQGFDVHKFDTQSDARETVICGVMVPSPYPLAGHSDADVGIHAIVDAIFGALCIGDIGDHFPPSDPKWKGADSAKFLTYAIEKLKEHKARLNHIDVTIICETPKIGPHKAAMKARIADLCALSQSQVNIKATTTEKLGFTGRHEGIATMTSVTIAMGLNIG